MGHRIGAWDRALFLQVATRRWPGAEPVLPRLSRAADHGVLWLAGAGALAVAGGRRGRRAALRGVGSLALASLVVNTVGKRSVRRARPVLDEVPVLRRLARQPFTTSFPSGHAASAAAFATGVALQASRWAPVVIPVAASVAFSRIYTGVHYPSDVLAGAAVGTAAALLLRAVVPVAAPAEERAASPGHPAPAAPALPDGEGLTVVVNSASGTPSLLAPAAVRLAELLPRAEVVEATEDDDLRELLEKASRQAAERGGALGVHGGDGTVNTAAGIAARHHVPLAVFPGGTRNHLALDLGTETAEETARAVREGSATAMDLAWFSGPDGRHVPFVNTFSLGAYPELVRIRERWSRRLGSWPASVLAAVHVLRTARPLPVVVGGRQRRVWLLFVGNCAYRRGAGLVPSRRADLADGLLDVRVVDGGRFARTRLLAAALTGGLARTPVYSARRLRSLRVGGLAAGTHLAYDGEVAPAPAELTIRKAAGAVVVYRPA
ncbi:phosphatase PAP2 family protein [Streptantibioticus cattleyicolor]|uniref:DAGKc domain-containing protein n=1 Tax=Streptantibioticus cattleyicolor (strain ATCC 35852 / DSM 46488 / JCM 4925 / NBRC 14057 / NRRL 8057) TaxID=1003195 RepID=G8WXU8_STREN|nr:phosphatase PAP2 family protein [Streptantibioticus cattleyicolor]AEW97248.1 hypothetical protein SCATT_48770 [Streptantibioticus cattleyicolor NRRL 8057 = DSM 46488]